MSTTTTDQGVRCGNHGRDRVYHADRNAVRACFQGRPTAHPTTPSQAPQDHFEAAIASEWGVPATPRNADEARNEGIRRLANQRSPFFQDRNMGRTYPASEKQISFITDLVGKYMGEKEALGQAILAELPTMTSEAAKATITALLAEKAKRIEQAMAPKQTPADPTSNRSNRRGWDTLIKQIMGAREERNFCIIDEAGKARFYRISKRGKQSRRPGTWKIQERVTDMLLPRYDSMLATVAQAIIDQGGAEAAGRRFAELMHRCYECGASLTDTTGNPYYSIGLGPECGSK